MAAIAGFSQDKSALMEKAITVYSDQYKFTGTVLVAKQGKIILQKAYGYKNVEKESLNTLNTSYQVASLAKQFTAAVILKLQEQGRLSVNDLLVKYYPDFPNSAKITIHHLLSHTSGIFNYTNSKDFMSGDQSKPVSLDSMISIFRDKPLGFEPGTKFSYSNSGYTMLGYIIEKITGEPYRAVLDEMILKPLQLTDSGYDFLALEHSNKSTGYTNYAPGMYQVAKYVHPSILYTTGALYTTVADLYKWHRALMSDKFLSAASKEMMYKPVAGPYGYGWFSDSLFGKKRLSHDGSVQGFKSNINRIPEDDVCIIALSNSNSSSVGQMVRVLMCILYDQPYQLPVERKYITIADDSLKQYIGLYDFGAGTNLTVTQEKEGLFLQGSGVPRFQLFAESPTVFFGKFFDATVEFVKDPGTGSVVQILFYQGKQKYTGQKVTKADTKIK
jgi:CubicO group peptidase (beta-lactamase class C family)